MAISSAPNYVSINQISFPQNRTKLIDNDGSPSSEWAKWFNNVQVTLSRLDAISFASSMPVSDPSSAGQIIFNTNPVPGGKIGWVSVTTPVPGPPPTFAWKEFGPIDA